MTTPDIALTVALSSSPAAPDQAPPTKSAPSPYIEGTSIQFAWDNTSLGTYKECPRKYLYSQLRGLRRKRGTELKLQWGQAFHKALEVHEQNHDQPRPAALRAAMDSARAIALGIDTDDSGKRTPETLFRTIEAYTAKYASEPLETVFTSDGKPAVELSFQLPLDAKVYDPAGGYDLVYCGHFDRVVNFQGTPYVLDTKTTGSSIGTEKGSAAYFAQYTPDAQISGYCWGAEVGFGIPVRGAIIDAVQIAKTKTEFAREIVRRTPDQIAEWRDGAIWWMRHAAASATSASRAKTEEERAQHYPQNERACHKFGGCTYRGICGRDPGVREAFLNTEFEPRQWNPLASRTTGSSIITETESDE